MSQPQDPWPPSNPPSPYQPPQYPQYPPAQYPQYPPPQYPPAQYPQSEYTAGQYPQYAQYPPQYPPPPLQPTWPAPTPPAVPPRQSRLPLTLGLIAGVIALMVVISAIFIVRAKTASADVRLEAVQAGTANPFMDNVGTDAVNLAPPGSGGAPVPGPGGTGTNTQASGKYSASTPGLYGGTLNNSSCDRDKMLTFLKAHTDEGREWARVVGVQFANLDSYFAELTPVLLRADTAVTNHGFKNGKATDLQAVLQAGTAVLVDRYGAPVAKCYCGNPLSEPASYTKPKYTGQTWSHWNPKTVIVVQKTTVVIEKFTLVDVKTNRPFDRVRGDPTGARDAPVRSSPTPGPSTVQPTPSPTRSSRYTKDDAIKLFTERDQACSGVKYPWSANPAKKVDVQGKPGQGDGVWVLTITHDNGVRVFVFTVDVPNKRITPGNELAAEAARYCPGFDA